MKETTDTRSNFPALNVEDKTNPSNKPLEHEESQVNGLCPINTLFEPLPSFNIFDLQNDESQMLPGMIKDIINLGETPEEKDLLLLGSLTVISSMMPNVHGIYGRKRLHPNLFLFVVGAAASGKGAVEPTLELARPLHEMQTAECLKAIDEWKFLKANKVEDLGPCPSFAAHIIPANTTATAFYRMLFDLKGKGLLFETEADTLSTMLSNKNFGNYTDGLRKAFHHEAIQYHRKVDNEHVEIPDPQLSVCLTGTPNQITNLLDNLENGLFSRFMFYHLNQNLEWKDQFANSDKEPLSDTFYRMGLRLLEGYKYLSSRENPLLFRLTEMQQQKFNDYFQFYQVDIAHQLGIESVSSVRRLAISAYRIAMVLSVLRHLKDVAANEEMKLANEIVCCDSDFYFSMYVIEVLISHLPKIYTRMNQPVLYAEACEEEEVSNEQQLLINLAPQFTRGEFTDCAVAVGIDKSRCRRLLEKMQREHKLVRLEHGLYCKAA